MASNYRTPDTDPADDARDWHAEVEPPRRESPTLTCLSLVALALFFFVANVFALLCILRWPA